MPRTKQPRGPFPCQGSCLRKRPRAAACLPRGHRAATEAASGTSRSRRRWWRGQRAAPPHARSRAPPQRLRRLCDSRSSASRRSASSRISGSEPLRAAGTAWRQTGTEACASLAVAAAWCGGPAFGPSGLAAFVATSGPADSLREKVRNRLATPIVVPVGGEVRDSSHPVRTCAHGSSGFFAIATSMGTGAPARAPSRTVNPPRTWRPGKRSDPRRRGARPYARPGRWGHRHGPRIAINRRAGRDPASD